MKNTFHNDLKMGNYFQDELIKNKGWKNVEVKEGFFKEYDLIDDEKIKWEVKSDRYTYSSGNICIEFKNNGKDSGITTSESDYYAYFVITPDGYYHYEIPTRKIKKYIRQEKYKKVMFGGYLKRTEFYLFSSDIFKKYLIEI